MPANNVVNISNARQGKAETVADVAGRLAKNIRAVKNNGARLYTPKCSKCLDQFGKMIKTPDGERWQICSCVKAAARRKQQEQETQRPHIACSNDKAF